MLTTILLLAVLVAVLGHAPVTLTVTAAEVLKTTTQRIARGTWGATVTAGKAVYLDTTTNTWKLAQATSAAASGGGTGGDVGIALNAGGSGQPAEVFCEGDIDPGGTLAVGVTYVVAADAAGGIAPIADLAQGNFPTVLGIATTAANLKMAPIIGGIAIA